MVFEVSVSAPKHAQRAVAHGGCSPVPDMRKQAFQSPVNRDAITPFDTHRRCRHEAGEGCGLQRISIKLGKADCRRSGCPTGIVDARGER